VAEDDFVCWTFMNAVRERSIAAMKLDYKLIVQILILWKLWPLTRNHLATLVALDFCFCFVVRHYLFSATKKLLLGNDRYFLDCSDPIDGCLNGAVLFKIKWLN
jgi:hypothetical protein